jgi:hypothetical protein
MAEQTISQSDGAAKVKALVEAQFKSMLEQPKAQVATPDMWWQVWALGVILLPQPGNPVTPQKMVKVGDDFFVTTLVWFNPNGTPSPCNLITNLASSIDIRYATANVQSWALGPAKMNVVHSIPIVPNQCFYVDALFVPAAVGDEGLYEMSITAHIPGPGPAAKPPLAGFATAVFDFDWDEFFAAPRWEEDIPLRFMIYP